MKKTTLTQIKMSKQNRKPTYIQPGKMRELKALAAQRGQGLMSVVATALDPDDKEEVTVPEIIRMDEEEPAQSSADVFNPKRKLSPGSQSEENPSKRGPSSTDSSSSNTDNPISESPSHDSLNVPIPIAEHIVIPPIIQGDIEDLQIDIDSLEGSSNFGSYSLSTENEHERMKSVIKGFNDYLSKKLPHLNIHCYLDRDALYIREDPKRPAPILEVIQKLKKQELGKSDKVPVPSTSSASPDHKGKTIKLHLYPRPGKKPTSVPFIIDEEVQAILDSSPANQVAKQVLKLKKLHLRYLYTHLYDQSTYSIT